jgi:hypothetical protein
MVNQVRILAWVNIVFGSFGVLVGLIVMLGGSLLAGVVEAATTEIGVPVAVIQLVATIITIVVVALSLPGLILGYGLLNFRPWARILGLVLSAINLLNIPFGTILALWTFYVLLKPETEALFKEPPQAPLQARV